MFCALLTYAYLALTVQPITYLMEGRLCPTTTNGTAVAIEVGTLQCKACQEPQDGDCAQLSCTQSHSPGSKKTIYMFPSVKDIKDFLSCSLQVTHLVV